jgi:hypothetical protein
MLFAVLSEVRGGLTKADAVDRIRERRWFDIQPEDRLPYPCTRHTTHEHRWITIIAWARKDAVENHLMHTGIRNNWDLNGQGLDLFAGIAKGHAAKAVSTFDAATSGQPHSSSAWIRLTRRASQNASDRSIFTRGTGCYESSISIFFDSR